MSMKLVILGLLMEQNAHPYEMKQIMEQRHMDHFMKLQKGSLYYAVEQLYKKSILKLLILLKIRTGLIKRFIRLPNQGKSSFTK